ncbi:clustered mitochondria protein homolog [Poecilia reticulata]|uniref:Clustered mitochondria protein homolog n=1 Tax=Poecilia reticulata TaxID=8081 RepID=A0A3P9MYH6_POERE|nr:PREDICTED: clustered mitochondria protein homolog [Poecilia reticulata]XP_008417001.1 PREDICTED: clustered mitochondria protein homolog [Poecilia reticulata]XP_017162264.1 PREDICTED: clustered mitochondria protein homolog [Poecilia reticulata]
MKDKVKKGGGRNQVKTDVISAASGDDAADIKQDEGTAFPVKIQGAGVEPLELQVNAFWLVQDAIMALLSRNEVCPRSNLSLALAGTTLDPHAELQSLKGLKAGALIRLVEEPYTFHSARVHLARVVELLRASGPHDALREGQSPSVLETLTHTPDSSLPNGKSLKRSLSNSKGESANQDGPPPEYLLPGSSERPLMALLPHSSQQEAPSYLKDLSLSCWHPPPGHRKLQGDFMYMTVVTIEGRHCDITSCPKGFFLNRSTDDMFDPRPAQSTPVCHCLTDLLCHVSPTFKQAFTTLKNKPPQPPVEAMPTPYHTLCWLGPPCASRLQKNTFSRLGVDEQAAAQAPDWNEELQAARDLSQGSLEERLQRDKVLLQVNSAFVRTVMQAAETVVDGFVEPVNGNPEDPAFLWSGLFMSQGATSRAFGGERGRRAAQRLELKCVQAYSDLEALQGLHTLPTAIVDYRGVRLSAQGLAPGFESSDQDQKDSPASGGLLYGVNAGPQESRERRRLLALLAQAAKSLFIQRHVVVAPKGHQVPLFTSLDAQGLLGADGRFYLLDVFRSFPVDANFCPEEETQSQTAAGEEESSKSCKENEEKSNGNEKQGWPENYQSASGLPKRFPHSLCRLRPELVQAFIQHKHCQFTQRVKEKMDENGGFEECATACDSRATDAVRAACRDVGSVSDIIFEMRFNPNVFSPGIHFPPSESASTNLQEKLLREAAAFIITHQIPDFLQCCLHSNEAPMDGVSLKQALHQRGINLRYLGHVVKAISQSEHKEQLRHIMRLTIGEIFTRSAKRVFNHFLQGVDVPSLSAAVSHFLSCLLVHHFTPSPVGEEAKKKSRRRGRGAGASESTPWSMLTGSELWNLVCQDAVETYGVSDSLGSSPNHLVENYGLQKLSLLREFCLKTGVQLRLRDYILENQNKAPFSPDDILNIFPVVKHIKMPTADASKAYRAAQTSIQKGLLDQAHEQLKEAAYLYGRVCDDLDPEACNCNSLLAKVTFLQGKAAEARSVQLKTVVISERVLGFDHPNTIQQYALLAVYAYAGGETTLAQKCLLRARLLMLTVHGEDHPYTATLDSCLGLVLTEDQTGQFLKNALKLNTSFFGPADLHTALSHHLLAQWMCSKGDYRSAMTHEKEALSAFTSLFGEDHPQTSCSKEFLGTITKQAVKVERTLRQTGSETAEQTVECLSPTSETILEQMVLVTGIRRITRSDRFQEYKQKHLERKAAAAKELGFKLPIWPVNSHLVSREDKSLDKESGKEAGDKGTEADIKDAESQQENMSTDSGAGVLANGQEVEPAERSKREEKADVDTNGEVADGEAQTVSEGEMQSASGGKNREINGDVETISSPSALSSKLSWADIVSKSSNGTGGKAVNGVAANGAAEE